MTIHVLVVEDDPAYCRLVRRMLEAAGFKVTTAPEFAAAMPIIEGSEPLDLLIADVKLPAGTPHGLSIGMMAVSKRPELKVVYMTGAYDPTAFALYAPDAPLLRKPFTASEMMDAINTAFKDE